LETEATKLRKKLEVLKDVAKDEEVEIE